MLLASFYILVVCYIFIVAWVAWGARHNIQIGVLVQILPHDETEEFLIERLRYTGLTGYISQIDYKPGYGILYKVYFMDLRKSFWFNRNEFRRI